MADKSTPSPPDDSGPQAPSPNHESAGGRRPSLKRSLATVALAGALIVGISWYFRQQPVNITLELRFHRNEKAIRKARVELRRSGRLEAELNLSVVDGSPDKHLQTFRLRKGKYVLLSLVEYRDGTRRKTSRRFKISKKAHWVLHIR